MRIAQIWANAWRSWLLRGKYIVLICSWHARSCHARGQIYCAHLWVWNSTGHPCGRGNSTTGDVLRCADCQLKTIPIQSGWLVNSDLAIFHRAKAQLFNVMSAGPVVVYVTFAGISMQSGRGDASPAKARVSGTSITISHRYV